MVTGIALRKNACSLLFISETPHSVTATMCFPDLLRLGGSLVVFLHAASSKRSSMYAFVFFSWVENA